MHEEPGALQVSNPDTGQIQFEGQGVGSEVYTALVCFSDFYLVHYYPKLLSKSLEMKVAKKYKVISLTVLWATKIMTHR